MWSAWSWVTITRRPPPPGGIELFAKVGPASISRRSPPTSPAPRRAGGGSSARQDRRCPNRCRSAARPNWCRTRGCEASPGRRRLVEQPEEVGGGRAASCSGARREARRRRRRCRRRRPARTVLPRLGTGARNGASVSTSSRSSGNGLRDSCKVRGILEGDDAGQRDVEADLEPARQPARVPVKQWRTPLTPPFPRLARRGSRRCPPRRRGCG
jgi:hypothetical protein